MASSTRLSSRARARCARAARTVASRRGRGDRRARGGARRRDVVIFPPLRVFFFWNSAPCRVLIFSLYPSPRSIRRRSRAPRSPPWRSRTPRSTRTRSSRRSPTRCAPVPTRIAPRRGDRTARSSDLDVAPPKAPASARSLPSLPAVFSPKRPPVAVVNARPSPIRRDRLTNRSTNRSRSLPPRSGKTPRTSPR